MRIGFFGTPELASHCLQNLCENFQIAFVVAGLDKPYGRNRKIRICETKDTAMCQDIDVLQPTDLKDADFFEKLKQYNADIFVVVAYGRIIPEHIFNLPRLKTINLHPSLLPKYRGAAPIRWALINGEKETGITIQQINEKLDAGDIILQESFPVDENINAAELKECVIEKGSQMLKQAINELNDGTAALIKQNDDEATYCGKIEKTAAQIVWNKSATEIHNLVRGLNPKPVAWTTFRNKNIKIWKTQLVDFEIDLKPGEIRKYTKKKLIVGTGDGIIEILEIQPEVKRPMDGLSFINGQRISENDCFI